MAEYLKRDDVFSKADILTVHTKEYGSIDINAQCFCRNSGKLCQLADGV